ncbi:MAG: biotin--[acetyl-CoA-carboxylase] ligase [Pyrinomonadaceae bacterium]
MGGFPVQVLRFDSLASTNSEAARHAVLGASEGLCIIAAEQTAGRGRLQRQWASPKDAGLYFSVLLRPKIEQRLWPLITLAAALAVSEAVYECYELETDIKWPNDILVNEKKLCGILAETVETSIGRAVVLGIGINLTSKFLSADVVTAATSVEEATGKVLAPRLIERALIRAIQKRYHALQSSKGIEAIVSEWSTRSSYASGKKVRITIGDSVIAGTTRGIEIDGALRIETDTGEIRKVRAGDLTVLRPSES